MSEGNHRTEQMIRQYVNDAAGHIEKTWPLYSFVTSNPLSGLEDQSFSSAIETARALFGAGGYPTAYQFRQALENGSINRDRLNERLQEHGFEASPEALLRRLKQDEREKKTDDTCDPEDRRLNQILEKWLSVFLDEGRARWPMPGREAGLYRAWRNLAPMDYHVDDPEQLRNLPENKFEAIQTVLEDVSPEKWQRIFTYHLTELPGWVGYIKQRTDRSENEWAEQNPVELTDYLAVRLVLAQHLNATVIPDPDELDPVSNELDRVRRCFLTTWEETYRNHLIRKLTNPENREQAPFSGDDRPDAQLVFCIDTRSEIIRRHIESTGAYETHGYAGFFGIPVRRKQHGKDTNVDACPPVVEPEHRVIDTPVDQPDQHVDQYKRQAGLIEATKEVMDKLKKNVLAAFSYVEFSGAGYGLGLIGQTLFPGITRRIKKWLWNRSPRYEEVFRPGLESQSDTSSENDLKQGLSLEDRVEYAESAFQLMGWDTFAPVVVFTGHVSETANNPFQSSLCCGACAGNSGVPNAKMLAFICNDPEVRDKLDERGMNIPDDTVFVAAKHNTTTDEITLYADHVDQTIPNLDTLTTDLEQARQQATAERAASMPEAKSGNTVEEVEIRASDWAQTRPEWGLAGNASFIIGPNDLRRSVDLGGRAFLHTYDWSNDPDGSALEEIITGPLIVCQWINHQYFFSTVDTGLYGSGSKITHNPVGNFGVFQGNGGDLMGGLPLQSLKSSDFELQHEPIRLQNIVYAPYSRVWQVVRSNENVRQLIKNNWIDLTVIDPKDGDRTIEFHLDRDPPLSESAEHDQMQAVL